MISSIKVMICSLVRTFDVVLNCTSDSRNLPHTQAAISICFSTLYELELILTS